MNPLKDRGANTAPPECAPSSAPVLPQLLVVDPDSAFLQQMREGKKAQRVPPLTAQFGRDAIELIADPQRDLRALFIAAETAAPDAISVLRRARQLRPLMPAFLIHAGAECPIDGKTLESLKNCQAMPKDFSYSDLAARFLPASLFFDPAEVLVRSQVDALPSGQEKTAEEPEFLPIRADTFISGSLCYFDLYIRVSPKRFLKLVKAGDEFSPERLKGYLDKGIREFYIPRPSRGDYTAYSQRLISAVVKSPAVSPERKLVHAEAQGAVVFDLLREDGLVSPENLQFAENYVSLVQSLVTQLDLCGQNALVARMLNNPDAQDHLVGTVMFGGLLGRGLGFETRKSTSLIGMGCLLHDVGLFREGKLEEIPPESMTPGQKEIYLDHPMRGMKILAEVRGLDEHVPQIALNHHRRRNGTGFPNSSGLGARLNLPTEIVGMADEMALISIRNRGEGREAWLRKFELGVAPNFSAEIVDAVRALLEGREG